MDIKDIFGKKLIVYDCHREFEHLISEMYLFNKKIINILPQININYDTYNIKSKYVEHNAEGHLIGLVGKSNSQGNRVFNAGLYKVGRDIGRRLTSDGIRDDNNKDISIKEIELCLKIDKTTEFNTLASKDKKRITKQIKS